MRILIVTVFLALAGSLSAALAHHDGERSAAANMVVSHAWTVENAANAHANAVYLTLENTGAEADRLVGAEVDFARASSFRAPVMDEEGNYGMKQVQAIAVQGGDSITLQPGGAQIVLEDLQGEYRAGDHFHMTLTFEKAGRVEVEVLVEDLDEVDGATPSS
ncbi:copper chaperone PCu(A)C [Fodinicurvata sediminis]|uniref:copper chaperone PCu(A)C n=1 Tax=Fodinicurvata sediminis TaxID=1121832 RepID=UPI0003B4C199|nr:copper chaperone PCu(A)C [Fodinicurvata sediminis]